ncbi:MAG: hypothetical protein QXF61_06970 [Nitrososphaeria archaeon]
MLIIMAFSMSLTCTPIAVSASEEASLAISEADNALKRAFKSVLEAEKASANVSDLIAELNEAAGLLAEAENAYRVGNFREAVSKAEKCSMLANGVVQEALILKSSALTDAQRAFLQTLGISCVGCVAFLTALFFVWRWFRRAYVEKLLKMKPEVTADAED